jgi:hypothetical protein
MDWVIELDIVVLSQDGATAAAQDFAAQAKTHLEAGLSERAQQVRPAAGSRLEPESSSSEPDQPRSQRESDPRVSYVYRVTAAAAPLSADEWRSITQAANLRVVDRALSKHVRPEKSGRYTLFVLQGADVLAAGREREWVVGAHRHAWFTTATFPGRTPPHTHDTHTTHIIPFQFTRVAISPSFFSFRPSRSGAEHPEGGGNLPCHPGRNGGATNRDPPVPPGAQNYVALLTFRVSTCAVFGQW